MPETASPTPSATAALTTPAIAAIVPGTAVRGEWFTATTLETVSHAGATTCTTISKHGAATLGGGSLSPYARSMSSTIATATVLVVDDEPMVREVVARYLELDGLRVQQAADGTAAVEWLDGHRPDLVVLDIMLPGTDGLSILRRLRTAGDVPVILLTARADEIDRVLGLELGADDYVVKPFSPRELAARVRTVLRRVNAPTPEGRVVVDCGRLRIDPATRDVTVDGESVELTPKEFDLLYTLARSPRQVFSRRQLLAQVWDSAPEYQDSATVTVHVGRLRQKLEDNPDNPQWITTVWGVGYRFEP
jgi:DNA-binding response OmpR family regulator